MIKSFILFLLQVTPIRLLLDEFHIKILESELTSVILDYLCIVTAD